MKMKSMEIAKRLERSERMPRLVKKVMQAVAVSMATVARIRCPAWGYQGESRRLHVDPWDVGEVPDMFHGVY
jgi:hypothetical protein